ncbi:MAG TPA: DUF5329 domain-containing protein [Verrucomicrobiae bacterium]|nr:DUF5329 domain-containing protein [Verrucomicrobiae bacterium]
MKAFLVALAILVSFVSYSAEPGKTQKDVERLIASVEKSDCVFIRNGSEHSPKDAAQHMRRKYDHFKKQIRTPDDFIEKCATKSELSGKAYMVKLPDGKMVPCSEWLRAKLAKDDTGL